MPLNTRPGRTLLLRHSRRAQSCTCARRHSPENLSLCQKCCLPPTLKIMPRYAPSCPSSISSRWSNSRIRFFCNSMGPLTSSGQDDDGPGLSTRRQCPLPSGPLSTICALTLPKLKCSAYDFRSAPCSKSTDQISPAETTRAAKSATTHTDRSRTVCMFRFPRDRVAGLALHGNAILPQNAH